MNPNVTITNMNIKGREFILAEVSRGMGQIGLFRYTSNPYTATDVFYIEKEPIIKIFDPRTNDEFHNKHIMQISGGDKASDFIKVRIASAIDNYYNYNQELARSAIPILELLTPGLYVVHDSQMHPGNGSGVYFWNNYNVQKEVNGTAEKNVAIGDNNYTPCFLVPTHSPAGFQAKTMYAYSDKYKKGKKLAGVAYHVAGMFSALIEGHHAATAALINDAEFRCLVIEPLTGVMYDSEKNTKNRKIVALSSPYVKIPLEELPDNTLERFLITRRNLKPVCYAEIKSKMSKSLRVASRRMFPNTAYEKAEQLPDIALVESASAVDSLSEEQLAALLAGEVKLNDELIVNNNHHSSVVAAADFLRVTDFYRFVEFCVNILENKERAFVHKYIAESLAEIMHPIIQGCFATMVDDIGIIGETARRYMVRWEEYTQKRQDGEENYHRQRKKKVDNMKAIAESKGIATLEAAVRTIGDLPKGVRP